MVERGRWLSADDYDRAYALSRMYPGIHILAQAVLIGYLVRGWGGALACSLGLLALLWIMAPWGRWTGRPRTVR